MNWLTKILKKEKGPKKENRTEGKAAADKPDKRAGETGVKVQPAEVLKKFDRGVLLAHHLTEKTAGALTGQYVFKVFSAANKTRVKTAVKNRFGVRVKSVHILNTPGKERKRGRQIGFKPGFKKAIVALEDGQSIEIT